MLIIACVVAVVPSLCGGETDPGPFDPYDRESARAWFNHWWPKTYGEPMGFTGDPNTGAPGTTALAYQQQLVLRLNMFRRWVGAAPVVLDPDASAKAQAAAVLCAANDALSHNPPTTWRFYSATAAQGAAASQLDGRVTSTSIIDLVDDLGATSAALAHRTALIEPSLFAVGVGSSPPASSSSTIVGGVTAIFTVGLASQDQARRFEGNIPIMLWPRGHVPYYLIPSRWSAGISDASTQGTLDFSGASVAVTRDGRPLTTKAWTTKGGASVVFTVDGTDSGVTEFGETHIRGEAIYGMKGPVGTSRFHVVITGLKVYATGTLWNGSGVYEYDVIAYDPGVGVGLGSNLINISTRAVAGSESSTLIAGFVLRGSAERRVLIRAGGPWLTQFDLDTVVADPVLTVYEDRQVIASNDDWDTNGAEVLAASKAAGIEPFPTGSKDSGLVLRLRTDRPYTAHVSGKAASVGNAIVEIYDVEQGGAAKLVNISTRSFVGRGVEVQIGGFIMRGEGPRKVLIRASGPNLLKHGVTGILADPVLRLFEGARQIAENNDWGDDAGVIAEAASILGAEAFEPGSKDAAIVAVLDPEKPYTAQVSGRYDTTGNALIEVFAFP